MRDAALDPARQKGKCTTTVRNQDVKLREPIPHSTQQHPGDGNRRLEREPQGKRQNMPVVIGPWPVNLARQAVMGMQEDEQAGSLERGIDGIERGVVQASTQARRADDDAAHVLQRPEARNLGHHVGRGRGQRQRPKRKQPALVRGAHALDVVVDGLGRRRCLAGVEPVEPWVRERDYRDVDAMCVHEGELLFNVIVFGADGAAARGRRSVFCWQDDEAFACAGRGIGRVGGEGCYVGDLVAGAQEGRKGWGIDVGVDVDNFGRCHYGLLACLAVLGELSGAISIFSSTPMDAKIFGNPTIDDVEFL